MAISDSKVNIFALEISKFVINCILFNIKKIKIYLIKICDFVKVQAVCRRSLSMYYASTLYHIGSLTNSSLFAEKKNREPFSK